MVTHQKAHTKKDREILIKAKHKHSDFNPEFSFDFSSNQNKVINDHFESAMGRSQRRSDGEIPGRTSLEAKIQKVKEKAKKKQEMKQKYSTEMKKEDENTEKEKLETDEAEENLKNDAIRTRNIKKIGKNSVPEDSEDENEEEDQDHEENFIHQNTFHDFNLCRPLLKSINENNWSNPTPIQSKVMPVALTGKDITACAITGSGKTAAYCIPIVERLAHKAMDANQLTRVLIIVPTRELAVQVHATMILLTKYLKNKITVCLAAGGLDVKSQEASLRMNPDIVIATPGRLIDHIYNAPNWSIYSVEILVLDEADRILEENFEEQLDEISKQCSREKQTLLFSATMTEKVKDLERMCLKDPEKIFINENTEVADNLKQQFVRLREDNLQSREAMLVALIKRYFSVNTLVFTKTKAECHRLNIILGLSDLRSGELHGDMKQKDRLDSLRRFKKADIDILVCTDLASRGLDIPQVENVINYRLPNSYKTYVHRVGRTARAGKSGLSISIVAENDRSLFEKIIKMNKKNNKAEKLENRTIAKEVIDQFVDEISNYQEQIDQVLKDEEYEKSINLAEKDLVKAEKKLKKVDDLEKITKGKKSMTKKQKIALSREAASKRGWFQKHHQRSYKEVDKNQRKPRGGNNNKNGKDGKNKKGGNFEVDLSNTNRKRTKQMRDDIGLKRKRR